MRLRKAKDQVKIPEPVLPLEQTRPVSSTRGYKTRLTIPAPAPAPQQAVYPKPLEPTKIQFAVPAEPSDNSARLNKRSRDGIGIKVTDTKIVMQVPASFHARQAAIAASKKHKWHSDDDDEEEDDLDEDELEADEEDDDDELGGEEEDEVDSLGEFDEDRSGEEEGDDGSNLGKRMTSRQLSIAMRQKRIAEHGVDDLSLGLNE